MNPYLIDQMIKERQREMIAEAERQRLVTLYNSQNPGRNVRILLALGDLLIRLGQQLKRRYSQPATLGSNLCRE